MTEIPSASVPQQEPTAMSSPPPSGEAALDPRLAPRPASTAAITANMTPSSTPLGNLNAARRPPNAPPVFRSRGSGLNMSSDIAARMKAFHLTRQGAPANRPTVSTANSSESNPSSLQSGGAMGTGFSPTSPPPLTPIGATLATPGGVPAGFQPPNGGPPPLNSMHSAPVVPHVALAPKKLSLAEKRGLALPGGLPGVQTNGGAAAPTKKKKPVMSLSQMNGGSNDSPKDGTPKKGNSMIDKYSEYLDAKTGNLTFAGKAVISSTGVEFASGSSFSISLDEVDTLDELGKGNYGTVYKVRHSRPRIRRPGLGLAGNKVKTNDFPPSSPTRKSTMDDKECSPTSAKSTGGSGGTSGVIMAMKEMRLELEDAKFASIVMELDILHRCISPYIVDFYGAFFQEGAVYVCMEFMDGGSIDKIYGNGIPENILRKIAFSTVMGLKCLKDEHNIIHRDVKPTNILINTRGQVKICDFGVSGNLVASFAKTNIGCQSYMAPERISTDTPGNAGGGGSYGVQSDIWSLGLTVIECALGRYPYPPETYNNIFSQLSAIVNGDPPDLPTDGFTDISRNFVHGCLNKIPKLRPTYAMLLQHAWLAPLVKPAAILEEEEDEDGEVVAASATTTGDLDERLPHDVVDAEVGLWVIQTLEKKRAGKLAKSEKPALHAAPLDAVATTSPRVEKREAGTETEAA